MEGQSYESDMGPEEPGHMLPYLKLLSYDPSDLPGAKYESGIFEIQNLPFESI